MTEREPISKQLRWTIYARDGFACRYCGGKPPDATLHIDHVHPVSLGGTNDEANLVTACSVCNLSKSANPIPEPIKQGRRPLIPLENVPFVAAVQSEFPQALTRLYDFFVGEAKQFEEKGHGVEVAMSVSMAASIDLAAWLYLHTDSKRTKRDFIAMCATMFDERKAE